MRLRATNAMLLALTVTIVACTTAAGGAGAATVTLPATQDNTIYAENANRSNGAGQRFFAGRTNTGNVRRGLVAFGVGDSVPAGAVIDSVRLVLTCSRAATADLVPVALHRLTVSWGEGSSVAGGEEGKGAPATGNDCTWSHRFFSSDLWSTPGGDFATAASASTDVGLPGVYSWGSAPEMVADVQLWLDDAGSNHGWMLIGDELTNQRARRFDSRQHLTAANHPQLVVDYHIPNPVGPATWGGIKSTFRP